MKFVVRSKSELTKSGEMGAYLFVLSPIAAIVFASLFFLERADPSSKPVWPIYAAFTLLSVAGFLTGYIMFALGKETISIAASGDDAQ